MKVSDIKDIKEERFIVGWEFTGCSALWVRSATLDCCEAETQVKVVSPSREDHAIVFEKHRKKVRRCKINTYPMTYS